MGTISGRHLAAYTQTSSALGRGYETFLAGWPWGWLATLTFADEVAPVTAHRRFRRTIVRIETALGQDIFWAKVQAPQRFRGVIHIHALMGGGVGFQPMPFIKCWERYGWARITPIHDLAGAIRYVVGHILRDGAEIDFSENAHLYQAK